MENEEQKALSYEAAVSRLEKLAAEMEDGNIAVDTLTDKLKEAQALLAFCKERLTKVDDEVKRLLQGQP